VHAWLLQGRKGHFPEADKDPVIQIANTLSVQGQAEPVHQNVLTLGGCLPIVGAQVSGVPCRAMPCRASCGLEVRH
jgi:hypothetical protein